jgi:hypothetical protein
LETTFDAAVYDATLRVGFATHASSLTPALVSQASPAGPPLAAFKRLPRDSGLAMYTRGATAEDLAPLRTLLEKGFGSAMKADGYAQADVDSMTGVFGGLFLTGGPCVVASGHRLDPARAALNLYVEKGLSTERARSAARAALQGWVLVEVDEPPTKWIEGIRAVQKLDKIRPTASPTHESKPREEDSELAVTPLDRALRLPDGTLHLEVRATPNRAWIDAQKKSGADFVPPIAHTTHVFVVPDADRTWFAISEDPALAAVKARVVLKGDPAETLESRDGLEALRASQASAGAFVTPAEITMLSLRETSDEDLRKARSAVAALDAWTAHGGAPTPIWTTVSNSAAAQDVAIEVHARLALSAARDLVHAFTKDR